MKRIIGILLCLLLALPLPARAAMFQDVQYVVDQADMLTDQENIYLDNRAEEISSTWGVDVFIAIVEEMDGEAAGSYAASLNGSRSWWDSDNAVLFLLAMEEREWYIATFGTAMDAFSDAVLDELGYDAAAYFSAGDYSGGFDNYLSGVESCFLTYTSGMVYDSAVSVPGPYSSHYAPETKTVWSVLPTSLLIGLVVAAIALLTLRGSMNTKRRQRSAADYLTAGSFDLCTRHDIFLYSRVSKIRRQQSSGSAGGTSVHRSSGGRSHGGRGGKF